MKYNHKKSTVLYIGTHYKKLDITIVIFYTETLTGKVVYWCFLFIEILGEKIHNSTSHVKISV